MCSQVIESVPTSVLSSMFPMPISASAPTRRVRHRTQHRESGDRSVLRAQRSLSLRLSLVFIHPSPVGSGNAALVESLEYPLRESV